LGLTENSRGKRLRQLASSLPVEKPVAAMLAWSKRVAIGWSKLPGRQLVLQTSADSLAEIRVTLGGRQPTLADAR
jgi:hypothetical protein